MLEKRREPARLQHVQEGMEKAGPKAKYERMGKAGLDWGEERRHGRCANRRALSRPPRKRLCLKPCSAHRLNSWPAPGFPGDPVAFNSPVSCHSVPQVRVFPYESAADAQVSLHYFFRFSFISFLFFISLFFFNFLFCLGSCLASGFLFLSLFRLTIDAFCPALFKTSFHSSSSPRITY